MEYLYLINLMSLAIGILFSLSFFVRALMIHPRSLTIRLLNFVAFSAICFFTTFFAVGFVPFIEENNVPGAFVVLLAVASSFVPTALTLTTWKKQYTFFLILGICVALLVLVPNMVFQDKIIDAVGTPQFTPGPFAPFFFGTLALYPLAGIILYGYKLRHTKDAVMRYMLASLGITHSIFAVYLIATNVILPTLGYTRLLPYTAIAIVPLIIVMNAILPYLKKKE